MHRRLVFRAAYVSVFALIGCSNKRDLGNVPDGGGAGVGRTSREEGVPANLA